MEIFRPLIGFVLGVAVMAGAYVGGLLDRIPHARAYPDDPYLHARYHIHAKYLPSGDRNGDCPPQYEFHNGTNRLVSFSAAGYDDHSHGGSGGANQTQVSMTPDYGPPSDSAAQQYGSQSNGDQGYGPPESRGSDSYDSRSDSDRDYGPDGGDDVGYSQDDIQYRGDTSGPCNPGVVQLFVDRKK